eukprot:scpid36174/ scgid6065/ 
MEQDQDEEVHELLQGCVLQNQTAGCGPPTCPAVTNAVEACEALKAWLQGSAAPRCLETDVESGESGATAAVPSPSEQRRLSPLLPTCTPVSLSQLLLDGSTAVATHQHDISSRSNNGGDDGSQLSTLACRPAQSEECCSAASYRPSSACSSHSVLSESLEELVAGARDPVWKRITRHCGHAHVRRKPIEWSLLRTRTMFTGSVRLSLLESASPAEHGLEMPTTGDAAVDGETGMFRTEDELAAFHRKMADMKAMLDDELEELRDQELGIYAQRVEEDMRARKIFQEMQAVLEQETQELKHQDHVIELEVREKLTHPEPVINRPDIDTADDEFTRRQREEGLRFKSHNNTEAVLHYDDLPPELDLDAVMNNALPIPEPQRVLPSQSTTLSEEPTWLQAGKSVDSVTTNVSMLHCEASRSFTAEQPERLATIFAVPSSSSFSPQSPAAADMCSNNSSNNGSIDAVASGSPSLSIDVPALKPPSRSVPVPVLPSNPAGGPDDSNVPAANGSNSRNADASPSNSVPASTGSSSSSPACKPVPTITGSSSSSSPPACKPVPATTGLPSSSSSSSPARKPGIPAHPSLDIGVTVMKTRKRGWL